MTSIFEFYVNGFPYTVTKVSGLTSSPEGFIDVERPFKPGGDYFRKWLASGDERAAEARLYGSGVHPVCTWAFSATPRYHDYSGLGEEGELTETLTLHCRDIRVNDQVNPMASRPEEAFRQEDELGESEDFVAPLAEEPRAYEVQRLIDAPAIPLPDRGLWISVSGGIWRAWNETSASEEAAWSKVREFAGKDCMDSPDFYRVVPRRGGTPASATEKPVAGELPKGTVIRTGDPFVFEKAGKNAWLMPGWAECFSENEIQNRIDSRETTVLYRPQDA